MPLHMTTTSRFGLYAASQTAVVAVLAGIAARLTLFSPFGINHDYLEPAASDLAALASVHVVRLLLILVAALFVVIPVAVAWYLIERGDRSPLEYVVGAAVAIGGIPVLLGGVVFSGRGGAHPEGLAVASGFLVGLVVAYGLLFGSTGWHRGAGSSLALLLNHVLVGTFVAAFVLGALIAPAAQGLVVEHDLSSPAVSFEFTYRATGDDRGVLTITHDGGDAIGADRVTLRGEGFAAVDGVDRSRPGPWTGDTTELSGGRAESVIEEGDAVDVGVADGCTVYVVYEIGSASSTIGKYTCGE